MLSDSYQNKIEECIKNAPLSLINTKDPEVLEYINTFLPYSIGIEIECGQKDKCNSQAFRKIPYIMYSDINNYEQRLRIPNGLHGIICLYLISCQLKNNHEL